MTYPRMQIAELYGMPHNTPPDNQSHCYLLQLSYLYSCVMVPAEESGTQGLYLAHLTPVTDIGNTDQLTTPTSTGPATSAGGGCPFSGGAVSTAASIASSAPYHSQDSAEIDPMAGCPFARQATDPPAAAYMGKFDQRILVLRLIEDCVKLLR
jgi:hypothetical protein